MAESLWFQEVITSNGVVMTSGETVGVPLTCGSP
jgi:hypothetical protein